MNEKMSPMSAGVSGMPSAADAQTYQAAPPHPREFLHGGVIPPSVISDEDVQHFRLLVLEECEAASPALVRLLRQKPFAVAINERCRILNIGAPKIDPLAFAELANPKRRRKPDSQVPACYEPPYTRPEVQEWPYGGAQT